MKGKINPVSLLKDKIGLNENRALLNTSGIVTFLNLYSYYLYRENVEDYRGYDLIFCDGILFQKMVSLIGLKPKRVSFDMTSLAPLVFKDAIANNKKIAIVGSDANSITLMNDLLKEEYPELRVVYSRHGYFADQNEFARCLDKLLEIDPHIVIAGLGTPLQDQFLSQLKSKGWFGVGYTCGGFIHQTAKKGISYYPVFVDKLNLRWLYRIYDEPKLMRRYFLYYPYSAMLFIKDIISYKLKKNL
ncbi:WecB/TagA/CpsF family glycosyltransferase [Klebsiella variicola]|uniref:WecB/TagA/CpsF family glycosyltransferase n=1 Tax=Klebsiella variicola TaxID=244366 RepID=UPI00143CD83A|nr:WecB/TagA/CpsF family glycosyltransferase [Klebsiella variicola]MBA6161179.1 WecB/TagA/CpsF family glycosyltransferase [Klebsiella variicola]MEA5430141.1 WecB/TagA/CpsF family glycosyltransferase [Klebsiella variicola]